MKKTKNPADFAAPPAIRLNLTPEQSAKIRAALEPNQEAALLLGYVQRHPAPELMRFSLIAWLTPYERTCKALEAAGIMARPGKAKGKEKPVAKEIVKPVGKAAPGPHRAAPKPKGKPAHHLPTIHQGNFPGGDTVTIDLGDVAGLLRKTTPNARLHWAAKSKATKQLRALTGLKARQARPDGPRWESATARITLRVPDRRRRDTDNILASCKAAFDGLVDARLLSDDRGLAHLPVEIAVVPRDQVGLTLTLREQSADIAMMGNLPRSPQTGDGPARYDHPAET